MVYDSAAQFEQVFTELFDQVASRASGDLDGLVQRRMVVQFRVREPEVELWVDGRQTPPAMSFAPAPVKPTLALDLTADTLHELLLGTLPLGRALRSRRLRVKGSKLKAMQLEDLFHAFQAVYPALAADRLGDG